MHALGIGHRGGGGGGGGNAAITALGGIPVMMGGGGGTVAGNGGLTMGMGMGGGINGSGVDLNFSPKSDHDSYRIIFEYAELLWIIGSSEQSDIFGKKVGRSLICFLWKDGL